MDRSWQVVLPVGVGLARARLENHEGEIFTQHSNVHEVIIVHRSVLAMFKVGRKQKFGEPFPQWRAWQPSGPEF